MLISEWGKREVLFDSKNPFYFNKDGLWNGTPFSFRERFQMTTSTIETDQSWPTPTASSHDRVVTNQLVCCWAVLNL
jgi:hypothetical protein